MTSLDGAEPLITNGLHKLRHANGVAKHSRTPTSNTTGCINCAASRFALTKRCFTLASVIALALIVVLLVNRSDERWPSKTNPAVWTDQSRRTTHKFKLPPPDDFESTTPESIEDDQFSTVHSEPFRYLLQSDACDRDKPREKWPQAVIYVKSGVTTQKRQYRMKIRETWGAECGKYNMSLVFVIGLPAPLVYLKMKETQRITAKLYEELNEEHDKYGDLFQANFLEEWDHLVNKYWAQLYFHASRCQHVPLMIMTDDDLVLLPNRLHRYIQTHPEQFTGLKQACSSIFYRGEALREPVGGKYYISKRQWPPHDLPMYCTGTTQITTTEAVMAMADVVPKLGVDYIFGFAQLDDVASGLIASTANVSFVQIKGTGVGAYPPLKNICKWDVLGLHGLKPLLWFDKFWELRQQCCLDGSDETQTCKEKIEFKKERKHKESPVIVITESDEKLEQDEDEVEDSEMDASKLKIIGLPTEHKPKTRQKDIENPELGELLKELKPSRLGGKLQDDLPPLVDAPTTNKL